ncbi:MAG: serine/threonine-protein phosphatase [Sphingobacteriales bacterium]|nr:MAG: serine/threonine-protein phosphatase [Sphingobacteriales bacterium]
MSIILHPPVFLHEKGKRKNNQDAIYPVAEAATALDRLFMVCDGVGGASKGEVASRMVCDLFHAYFNEHGTSHVDEKFIANALKFAEEKLTEYTSADEEANNMSTTLTLLYFDDIQNKALVSWCGDSRIYHIRNGEVIFVSEDHSLVQELVKRGELTMEEAQTHPQKNIILRAISGTDAPTKADVVEITDVQANDYFLLCSDGILEGVDQRLLLTLLNNSNADINKVREHIYTLCLENSRDNFSMYLIQVQEVTKAARKSGITKILTHNSSKTTKSPAATNQFLDEKTRKIVFIFAGVAVLALLLLFTFGNHKTKADIEYQDSLNQAKQMLLTPDSVEIAKRILLDLEIDYPNKKNEIEAILLEIAKNEELARFEQENAIKLQTLIDSINTNVSKSKLDELKADSAYFVKIKESKDIRNLDTLLYKLKDKNPSQTPSNPVSLPAQNNGTSNPNSKDAKNKKENYNK